MKRGILGFPRLTNAAPLVGGDIIFSQEISDSEEVDAAINNAIEKFDVDKDDPTEDDLVNIVKDVSEVAYPPDAGPVSRAKRARFLNCMANDWSIKWVDGLAESTDTVPKGEGGRAQLDRLKMQMRGCLGVTESNVADDESLIPNRFKD